LHKLWVLQLQRSSSSKRLQVPLQSRGLQLQGLQEEQQQGSTA
jgi:hypothetical protein